MNFIIYSIAIFLIPTIQGLIGFLFFIVFSPILSWGKKNNRESFLNLVVFFIKFGSSFLAVSLLKTGLMLFNLKVTWLIVVIIVVIFLVFNARRIRASSEKTKRWEVYETLGDLTGIIIAGLYFIV